MFSRCMLPSICSASVATLVEPLSLRVLRPDCQPQTDLSWRYMVADDHDAITRTAHLVAAARDQILNRFGDELALARQHQLQPEEQAQ
ncbi:hypothetical protein C0046_40955 [Pseudomonas aeruginosa]|nr:hypothetical protein C0046_40955 [Pseudomonas aeruginosa]